MTQEHALQILKSGANVFLTGEPGAGKSYVVNQYIAWLEAAGLNVAVTASTGIAATHIGGMTIHAWSGIGVRDALTPYDLEAITTKEKIVKRAKAAQVLIIDEISMLDGGVLDMVDQVLRAVRQSVEPFGGLQVVLVGDFFQLPPVTRGGEVVRYAFESRAWQQAKPITCYLSEQYRQDDELLLSLLSAIRRNEIEEDHYTLLQEQTAIAYEHIEPTRLYTHNADVDAVNAAKLAELPGAARTYRMQGMGRKPLIEGLMKNCLSPETLVLKEEAMVMCTKNNFEAGYVNGTLARVVAFEDSLPVIELLDGTRITVKPTTWEIVEDKKVLASIEQLPLRLAWAITVHKSQGMSLDAAEVDLSKAFVYGQGYVALSRVRTLAGLKVNGMHPNALQVDPRIVHADKQFKAETEAAIDAFTEMEESEILAMHERFVVALGGRWPVGDVVARPAAASATKPVSTFTETHKLLRAGKQIAQIARARNLTPSTVWSHLEKLHEEGALTLADTTHLEPPDWGDIQLTLFAIMDDLGTEKLKPIFEAAEERYDYDLIRLARLQYQLSQVAAAPVF